MPGEPTKPVQEAIAFYWTDSQGRFSAVKRPPTDAYLPNVWGLPSGTPNPGETPEAAVVRSARNKLAVDVEVVRYVGDDTIDRGKYVLHLREYEVKLTGGIPTVPQSDPTITQYTEFKMTDRPEIFHEAATKGSLCSRIFLRNRNLWPESSANA